MVSRALCISTFGILLSCAVVCCVFAAATLPSAEVTTKEQPLWVPAKAYSIEVGTSQVKELIRSVGKPKRQTDNQNTIARGGLVYQYDVTWPASGELWAFVDAPTKVVTMLMFK